MKLSVWRVAISIGSLNIVIAIEAVSEAAAIAECRNIVGGVYKNNPIIVHRNLDASFRKEDEQLETHSEKE